MRDVALTIQWLSKSAGDPNEQAHPDVNKTANGTLHGAAPRSRIEISSSRFDPGHE